MTTDHTPSETPTGEPCDAWLAPGWLVGDEPAHCRRGAGHPEPLENVPAAVHYDPKWGRYWVDDCRDARRGTSPSVVPGDTSTEGGEVRVWQRPDGTLVIRDEDENYGSDVFWLGDMDQPPADAVPLAAHLPSVVPGDTSTEGGDVRAQAKALLHARFPELTSTSDDMDDAVEALAAAGLLATAATEGRDVRDRAREKVERELQQSSAGWPSGVAGEVVSALAAAELLAAAGTEGEAEAARLQELNGVLRTIAAIGAEAPASAVRDYVRARATALGTPHSRAASPQGEDLAAARDAAEQYGVTIDGTESPRDLLVALLVEQGHAHPRDVIDALDVLGLDVAAPRAVAPVGETLETVSDMLDQRGVPEVDDPTHPVTTRLATHLTELDEAPVGNVDRKALREGVEVPVWGADRERGYAVGVVSLSPFSSAERQSLVVQLRHSNFERQDEGESDRETLVQAFMAEEIIDHDYGPLPPSREEAERMADVALAALRGETGNDTR